MEKFSSNKKLLYLNENDNCNIINLKIAQAKWEYNLFNYLIIKFHYLQRVYRGRSLRIFAICPHEVIKALIQFGDPYGPTIYKKFGFKKGEIIENNRFLLLSHQKNLGSKVLSKSIKFVCNAWKEKYNVKPKLCISYVDPSKGYKGTVYKAANFKLGGITNGDVHYHKSKHLKVPRKMIFVKKI